MTEPDLFAYGYPNVAGFKRFGTSSEAAQSVDAKTLRAKVLEELCNGPGTADELALRLRVDKLSIRPRCSELAALGQIEDSGQRHLNSSNKRAIVWQVRSMDLAA
jgi:predicted transcriptional regulator